jgi:16S rRNA (cytosine967-C5)-methyltransferase
VLRKVVALDWTGWVERLGTGRPRLDRLALQTAHPRWIAQAFSDALGARSDDELEEALLADDSRPQTHLIAWPGVLDRDALLAVSGGEAGPWSPYAIRLSGGDPGDLEAIRTGRAAVQDEGSQLCAIALTKAPIIGRDERWLDLCAGPGGKAALLAALGQQSGAHLVANELHPHRAELVAKATARWNVRLDVGDARRLTDEAGGYDRVLLDAPCSGLGALRRRPEARWRRSPADVAELATLQRELLASALRLVRPGGVVAYVTCSPHPAETTAVIADSTADSTVGVELVDARPLFVGVPDLGDGPTVQLWPHRHGTDAMFFALLRRAT